MAPKNKGGKGKKVEINSPTQPDLIEFSWNQLVEYGNGLSKKTKLGAGVNGTVHKGTIPVDKKKGWHSPQIVAIKAVDNLNKVQVDMEKDVLGEVKHPNIIKLVGYHYPEIKPKMKVKGCFGLVYEFMPNGCLTEKHVSDFNWDMTLKTIKGIVSAICCLHEKNPPIIHRDLKPDNILLDEEFNVKLADFGLAARGGKGWTHGGKNAYSDPKAYEGTAIKEFDIYSIGILIMELFVKRKMRKDTIIDLPDWVRSNMNHPERVAAHLLNMGGGCTEEKVTKAMNLALRCTEEDITRRPKITEVMEQIEDLS